MSKILFVTASILVVPYLTKAYTAESVENLVTEQSDLITQDFNQEEGVNYDSSQDDIIIQDPNPEERGSQNASTRSVAEDPQSITEASGQKLLEKYPLLQPRWLAERKRLDENQPAVPIVDGKPVVVSEN